MKYIAITLLKNNFCWNVHVHKYLMKNVCDDQHKVWDYLVE